MATKAELVAQADAAGLTLTGDETVSQLKDLLATAAAPGSQGDADSAPAASDEAKSDELQAPTVPETPVSTPKDAGHVPVGSKAEAMRAKLHAEPKVRVYVPLAPGEKPGVTQSVILNGYSMYIRKGEYVDVPQSVAEILDIKLKHKLAIDNHPLKMGGDGEAKMTQFGS